jgi:predicted nucleotide-binding protein
MTSIDNKTQDNGSAEVKTLIQLLQQTQTARSLMDSNPQGMWRAGIDKAIGKLYGEDSTELRQVKNAMEQHFMTSTRQSKEERSKYIKKMNNERFDRIEGLLEEMISESESSHEGDGGSNFQKSKDVFIVYGHDGYAALQMEKIIREFGLNPKLLSAQANKGRPLIQKFMDEAKDIAYVFVLLTPDDNMTSQSNEHQQARPNMLFASGWFIGKTGLENVSIVCKKGTKFPSGLEGITRIDYESGIEDQYKKIMTELKFSNLI